jgi:threonine dehydratase
VETKRKVKKILNIGGAVAYYGDDVDGRRAKTKKRRRRGKRRRNFSSQ